MLPTTLVLPLLLIGACSLGPMSENAPPVDSAADAGPSGGSDGYTLSFYYGPMKPMYAESILYSVERITGHDFGAWDHTTPDPASNAFNNSGNANGAWYPHCRLLGGCMDHRIPLGRTSFLGTAYVLQLEKAVAEACYDRAAFGHFPGGVAPTESVQAIDIIRHQFAVALAANPTEEDLARSIEYFDSHIADPEFDDVTAMESAGRGHCRALMTTNRFLFY
ncbi:MAG: hypothetical protein GY811_11635 [Myxococcales bacterium]|nr:hypothetical protein [Myxococcales bacterium]